MNAACPPFTVLIPARMASSRLPNKPLADIAGVPMVVHVARRAAQSAALRCVVATDDARITQACEQYSVHTQLTANHHLSGSDRLAQACCLLDLADDAIVVNVQGDEPLVEPTLINAVATLLHADPQADMATAACPIAHDSEGFTNPNVVKVVLDARGHALYFSRAPIPHVRDMHDLCARMDETIPSPLRHVGIYSYRAGFLRRFAQLPHAPLEDAEALEQLRALWHGHRIAVHVTPHAPGPGVDTPADLERVRTLVQNMDTRMSTHINAQ